jgi:carbamoyltransferase
MNILGLGYWSECHDTSAAIICDGKLVAAAEEERFSRRKHDGRFPIQAISFCLAQSGLRMAEVDAIAFPDLPFRSGNDSSIAEIEFGYLRQFYADGIVRYRSLIHKKILDACLRMRLPTLNWKMNPVVAAGFATLRAHYENIPSVQYYGHHLAHAAAAYFTSGHERAAVATIDGRGNWDSTVTWRAENKGIKRLGAAPFTNSLGEFYKQCTEYLGLGKFGEGKTMGLASYGNVESQSDCVSKLLDRTDSDWYSCPHHLQQKLLGFPPRSDASILQKPYTDFAAAVQQALEDAVSRVVQSAIDDAKTRTLCLGGGVAFNCSSNGKLLESGIASSIWVFPAAGDAGLSVGAAFLAAAEAGETTATRLDHAYWGPGYNSSECEAALRCEPRVLFRRTSSVIEDVSRYLEAGEVIGWFQGRMEFGPRALGNRSILADPRRGEIRDRVNTLKGRELSGGLSRRSSLRSMPWSFSRLMYLVRSCFLQRKSDRINDP